MSVFFVVLIIATLPYIVVFVVQIANSRRLRRVEREVFGEKDNVNLLPLRKLVELQETGARDNLLNVTELYEISNRERLQALTSRIERLEAGPPRGADGKFVSRKTDQATSTK